MASASNEVLIILSVDLVLLEYFGPSLRSVKLQTWKCLYQPRHERQGYQPDYRSNAHHAAMDAQV